MHVFMFLECELIAHTMTLFLLWGASGESAQTQLSWN